MVHGFFVENTPLIRVGVAWGQAIQTPHFILDTGFTGDLQVTPQIATELGLVPIAVENVQIANGQTVTV